MVLMDKVELTKYSHSVGEANYHLQFTPKYRHKIFANPMILNETRRVLLALCEQLEIGCAGIGFGPDHVHLFVNKCKNYSEAELSRRLKGASSRVLRANLWRELRPYYWSDSFWTDGHFGRTVGAVTNEAMRKYINESQHKHWTANENKTTQTTMLQYSS
jgi:putative transposase